MIQKFKKIEDADSPPWTLHPDEEYYLKVREFLKMIEKLSDFKVIPGIQKFTNILIREPETIYHKTPKGK